MGGGSGGRVHMVSGYASTRAARREEKNAFFQELDYTFLNLPSGEKYVVLSDFNACVGPGNMWEFSRRH